MLSPNAQFSSEKPIDVPWDFATLRLAVRTVAAGICPALDSSLPWLELGRADEAGRTDSAGQ